MEQNQTQLKKNPKYEITTRSGNTIYLDKKTVEEYLANGQKITDSEFTMFFQLCKAHQVNPFLKEAYIIKYGGTPATIVLDYKVFQQSAEDNPNYNGMKHGVLVVNKDGKEIERTGSYLLPGETLIAGWCEVFRKDKEHSTKVFAMFEEFKQTKKDGEVNSNWAGKPLFMITKVAKAQALREAFPNMFGSNVYSQEEATTFEKPKDYIDVVGEEAKPRSKKTTVRNTIEEVDVETGEVSEFDAYIPSDEATE